MARGAILDGPGTITVSQTEDGSTVFEVTSDKKEVDTSATRPEVHRPAETTPSRGRAREAARRARERLSGSDEEG